MKGASEHTDLERVSSAVEAFSASDVSAPLLLAASMRRRDYKARARRVGSANKIISDG